MGEIAEDIINGRCCGLCGQYLVGGNTIDRDEYEILSGREVYEHGYPVACSECYEQDCGYQLAEVATF